ncbi:MAG: hypothetical protein PHQ90_05310 [Sulfuricurvum sp.]|nr:hypothetical protein [Sulfuricurvum sp.]
MVAVKWLLIILGMVLGIFTPWKYQVVDMAALLLGYAACYELKWPRFQVLLESLFGGLAMGLGLQVMIAYGMKNQIIPMIIAPLLTWLVLRIIFYGVETRYTLTPIPALSDPTDSDGEQPQQSGHSAWSGDTSGKASMAGADGRYMMYHFFCKSEICMGGPTYGDAVFTNGCAFMGVGPSIALSDDGRYAAMTLPSRGAWEIQLADLQEKILYKPEGVDSLWEIDRIEEGIIYGRYSPLTSNAATSISIAEIIEKSEKQCLIEDDGWWVEDYPERKPFPKYGAVSVMSRQGTHRVTFVPDLKPFRDNPFNRSSHPLYTVLVDDEMLGVETGFPSAHWIDGLSGEPVEEGRFLEVGRGIIDFRDPEKNVFDIQKHTELLLKECDEHTHLHQSPEIEDLGEGKILVKYKVMPRSVGWNEAEVTYSSTTYPHDENSVKYWDADGKQQHQERTLVEQHVEYIIDLPKYSEMQDPRNCTEIKLINRANPAYKAQLVYQNDLHVGRLYAAYTCITSCGLTLENVIHEAIWSHCGRYLAVVHFESPPKVPSKISIIDFETVSVRDIPGSYALPSFIWFDGNMLQFTHVVGLEESITYGPGKFESKMMRLTELEHESNPYDLLIGSVDIRRTKLDNVAESKLSQTGYASASVNQVSQHCILFAPDFDQPMLQPPLDVSK